MKKPRHRREIGTGRQDPRRDRAAIRARTNEMRAARRREARLDAEIDRLNRLEWLGLCSICENARLEEEYACCEECFFSKTEDGQALKRYVPYDEWESKNRILVVLRTSGWLGAAEIGDAVGIPRQEWVWGAGDPKRSVQQASRNALSNQIIRMFKRGLLERRRGEGPQPEYRLTDAGRAASLFNVDAEAEAA